jgi:Zn-dependent peptidase ImmA (M78 family)
MGKIILSRAMKGNPEDPKEKMFCNTFSLRPKDIDNLEKIMAEYGISNKSLMIRQLIAEKAEAEEWRVEEKRLYGMEAEEGD